MSFYFMPPDIKPCIDIQNFNVWFNNHKVLNTINLTLQRHKITCIIGPSGSGKSTLIRSINRINSELSYFKHQGKILFNQQDIYQKKINKAYLRQQIGMVFQRPCIFPTSINKNVLFGIESLKKMSKQQKASLVEKTLIDVYLWPEVAHRLQDKADLLSIGQQQRLCIARSLAIAPQAILLDEPTSALDHISTQAIEKLLLQLKQKHTIVCVTHDIDQAQKIADYIVFMCNGSIIEQNTTANMLHNPQVEQTKNYLNTQNCAC